MGHYYEVPHAEKSASGCLEFSAAIESASQAQHALLPVFRLSVFGLGEATLVSANAGGESVDGVGSGRGSRSRYEPRFSDPVGECLRVATMDSVEANTRHRHGGQCADCV